MSNKSRLQTNNTNLQALIDKANALPNVGGGSNIEDIWGSVYTNLVIVMHSTAFFDGKVVSSSWDIDVNNIVGGPPGGLLMGYTKGSTIYSDKVYLLSLEDCLFSGCELIATGTDWFIVKILEQDFTIGLTWEQA